MADCVICGKPAGFMQHLHPECEHERQAELDPLAAQKAAGIKASSTPVPEQAARPAFCGQCGAKVEAGMKFCSGCGKALAVAPAAAAETSGASPKKKTPLALWIVGVPVALVLLMFALASTVPEERARELETQRRVKAECEKWMSDAQLGDERRMTRRICEQMQADR